MEIFGKGFRQAIGEGFDHDAVVVVVLRHKLRDHCIDTETGVFGAAMEVELVNSGPVTLVLTVNRGKES